MKNNNTFHDATEVVKDPQVALSYLIEGNKRFVSGDMIYRKNNDAEWYAMQEGQNPFVAILSCSDSRVSPSVVFDQKNGDLFVIRNAGNVVDETVLGSLEYAVLQLEVPLIVVCGHRDCGAVTAAFDHMEQLPEHLGKTINLISQSIAGYPNIEIAEAAHVLHMAELIRQNPVVEKAGTLVAEAYYDLSTGHVHWMD